MNINDGWFDGGLNCSKILQSIRMSTFALYGDSYIRHLGRFCGYNLKVIRFFFISPEYVLFVSTDISCIDRNLRWFIFISVVIHTGEKTI